jgi:sugar phosphate isomerase/epimerase
VSAAAGLAPRLGIFARTFRRSSAAEVAAAVAAAGYALAHWNFAAIGQQTLAGDVGEDQFSVVRAAFTAAGLTIPSVSATFNVTHPDTALRERNTRDAVRLIGLAPDLGADVVTLCSGTLDPGSMWRAHPGNTTPEAWTELRRTLDVLLETAAAADVRLGIEPEPGNVVRDADAAARLLHELGDDAPVGIVFDAANLLTPDTIDRQKQILAHAVDLLGSRVISAQAKDVVASGYSAAGGGLMDYNVVFTQLARVAAVPLIVQDVEENDAARVRADLLRWHDETHTAYGAPR